MPYAVAAATVGAALIASNSASDASDKQAQSTKDAIAAQQGQADRSRQDLAPYKDAGAAALNRLRTLMGVGSSTQTKARAREEWIADNYPGGIWENGQYIGGHGIGGLAKLTPEQGYADYVNKFTPEEVPGAFDPNSLGDSPLLEKFKSKDFTSADMEADPVYQSGLKFGLDEGTKAIERRSAAGGGYDSGATLKGLTRFASDYGSTKAADAYSRFTNNQNNAYSRFTNDQNNAFGRLSGIAGMGSGATSVGVGAGANSASNLSGLISAQGNASAASSIAGGNALSGGINNAANYYNQNQMLKELQGGGARSQTQPTYV